MWFDIFTALALVLILEGLMPFVSPRRFRETLARLLTLDDRTLRTIGFICLLVGVIGLELVHWFR